MFLINRKYIYVRILISHFNYELDSYAFSEELVHVGFLAYMLKSAEISDINMPYSSEICIYVPKQAK